VLDNWPKVTVTNYGRKYNFALTITTKQPVVEGKHWQ